MTYARFVPATGVASATTFGLFFIMQSLVANNSETPPYVETRPAPKILIEEVKPPEIKHIDRLKPYEPIKTPEPPQNTEDEVFTEQVGIQVPVSPPERHTPELGPELNLHSDGAIVPIVRVEPQFPTRAAEKGINGWVVVEFTVTANGTIENPTIIDAQPRGYFERASLKAVSKFKYKPQVVNGVPVDTPNVFTRFNFQLDD